MGKEQRKSLTGKAKARFDLLPMVLGGVLIVTLGVIAAIWSLIDTLQENSKNMRSYKVKTVNPAGISIEKEFTDNVDENLGKPSVDTKSNELYRRGSILAKQNKPQEAIELYKRSLASLQKDLKGKKLTFVDRAALSDRADSLCQSLARKGDLDGALAYSNKAIEWRSNSGHLYLMRASIYRLLNRKDLYQADIKMAESLNESSLQTKDVIKDIAEYVNRSSDK